MRTFELGSKFFVDGYLRRWRPFSGPFDAFDDALVECHKIASSCTLRLRAGNSVYVESHNGEIFHHDPPRKFTNSR
jgi:hypothetical protein